MHSAEFARELLALATSYDAFAVNGREMSWLTRGNFSDSMMTGLMPSQIRNIAVAAPPGPPPIIRVSVFMRF